MTDFLARWPRFAVALDAIGACRKEHAAARAATADFADDRARRAALRLIEARRAAAYRDALTTIGDEMLPAILGDRWALAKRQPWFERLSTMHTLVDHPEYFRRSWARGRHTWKVVALVSQPYGGFAESARASARSLGDTLGVWAAPRVGPWNAPATDLVLIAPHLRGLDAAEFGFIDLLHGEAAAGEGA